MKRANELSVAGLLSETYYKEVLIPSIDGLKKTMDKIIAEHSDVVSKIIENSTSAARIYELMLLNSFERTLSRSSSVSVNRISILLVLFSIFSSD